jgi:hypothetical protein
MAAGSNLCFHSIGTGASNCAPEASAKAGQVYTAVPNRSASPGGCAAWSVTGLVPDGIDSLTVEAPGAKDAAVVPVTSNIYEATLAPVRTILRAGTMTIELPLDQFAAGNAAC